MSLPEGWVETTLGEVIPNYAKNKKISSSELSADTWVLELEDIEKHSSKLLKKVTYSERQSKSTKNIFDKGDVLYGKLRPYLNKVIIADEDGVCTTEIIPIKENEKVISKYIFYVLKSSAFLKYVEFSTHGLNMPRLGTASAKKAPFPLPPLKEQKQIAQKLDQVLARVERIKMALDNAPDTIKRFRQSVLAMAIRGGLTESWRDENQENIEAYRFKELDAFNDKRLMNLPSSWIWTEFRNVAKIKSNLVDPLLTPNDYHIAPNHIESGTGKLLEFQTVAEDNVKSGKHRFYSGQILYSKIRPYLNKVCLVDFDGLCSADMYPIEAIIDRKYLYYSILSNQFSYWTATLQGRVVLPKINQKALNTIPISVPPLKEQKAIVKKVEILFTLADNLEKRVNQAQKQVDRLTQSILAKAFRGEL